MAMKPRKPGRGIDQKGRSKRGGQFVPIPVDMARSAAWRSLTGTAVKVYIELRSRYNGGNNGDLSLSLDEAARLLGIGKATAQRAFAELEKKGFIKLTKRGRWYGRMASTYAATDRPHGTHPQTNDWRGWQPPGVPKNAFSVLWRTDKGADGTAMEPNV